jgi:hypothetical protein
MANTTQKVTMYEANRLRLKWTVTDKATGSALDLTGKIIKFAVARLQGSTPVRTDPLLDKKSGHADVLLISAVDGRVDTIITAADSADWAIQGKTTYHVELEVFEAGETQPVVVATVSLTVLPNVVNA